MTLAQILIFMALGSIYAVLPEHYTIKRWLLLIVSILAIYALQPRLNIRWLDYSLPTATLFITAACWYLTCPRKIVNTEETSGDAPLHRENLRTLILLILIPFLLTIPRYIALPFALTSRPPETLSVILTLATAFSLILLITRISRPLTTALIVFMIMLVIIKAAPLTIWLSAGLRQIAGQDPALASPVDLQWLGFSYVAFRLIHTLRDRQTDILPALTLHEYVTYVIFFPTYTAGPIDRAERFVSDLRYPQPTDSDHFTRAGLRISSGLFKKFILADALAGFSLSPVLAQQVMTPAALWFTLYTYAFRLYFDFSGYTDIAIGIGMLFGIRLPENFDRPYLQRNLTRFWQSWHKTLSDFARFYVYSPLTRSLLRQERRLSNHGIILIGNLATMTVIGLWHGITLPFFIWGLWHAFGLTIHKLWSDRTRTWYRGLSPDARRLWHLTGMTLTFHFVLLGWVWFALPDIATALHTFNLLFGINR